MRAHDTGQDLGGTRGAIAQARRRNALIFRQSDETLAEAFSDQTEAWLREMVRFCFTSLGRLQRLRPTDDAELEARTAEITQNLRRVYDLALAELRRRHHVS